MPTEGQNDPATQAVGALMPVLGQKVPTEQRGPIALMPVVGQYVPVGQPILGAVMPDDGQYEPVTHVDGAVAPAGQYAPAGHTVVVCVVGLQ